MEGSHERWIEDVFGACKSGTLSILESNAANIRENPTISNESGMLLSHVAIANYNLNCLKFVVCSGVSMGGTSTTGTTCLSYAILAMADADNDAQELKARAIADWIVADGEPILDIDHHGNTAIHMIAGTRDSPRFDAVLNWHVGKIMQGCPYERSYSNDCFMNTLKSYATRTKLDEMLVKYLLLCLPGWGFMTPLHYQCSFGRKSILDGTVMAIMRNMNAREIICNPIDAFGWTPLHYACKHGFHDIAVGLVEVGYTPLAIDYSSRNCIDIALTYEHKDIAETLVHMMSVENIEKIVANRLRFLHLMFPLCLDAIALVCAALGGWELYLRTTRLLEVGLEYQYVCAIVLGPPILFGFGMLWRKHKFRFLHGFLISILKLGAIFINHTRFMRKHMQTLLSEAVNRSMLDEYQRRLMSLTNMNTRILRAGENLCAARMELRHGWKVTFTAVSAYETDKEAAMFCIFLWWMQNHMVSPPECTADMMNPYIDRTLCSPSASHKNDSVSKVVLSDRENTENAVSSNSRRSDFGIGGNKDGTVILQNGHHAAGRPYYPEGAQSPSSLSDVDDVCNAELAIPYDDNPYDNMHSSEPYPVPRTGTPRENAVGYHNRSSQAATGVANANARMGSMDIKASTGRNTPIAADRSRKPMHEDNGPRNPINDPPHTSQGSKSVTSRLPAFKNQEQPSIRRPATPRRSYCPQPTTKNLVCQKKNTSQIIRSLPNSQPASTIRAHHDRPACKPKHEAESHDVGIRMNNNHEAKSQHPPQSPLIRSASRSAGGNPTRDSILRIPRKEQVGNPANTQNRNEPPMTRLVTEINTIRPNPLTKQPITKSPTHLTVEAAKKTSRKGLQNNATVTYRHSQKLASETDTYELVPSTTNQGDVTMHAHHGSTSTPPRKPGGTRYVELMRIDQQYIDASKHSLFPTKKHEIPIKNKFGFPKLQNETLPAPGFPVQNTPYPLQNPNFVHMISNICTQEEFQNTYHAWKVQYNRLSLLQLEMPHIYNSTGMNGTIPQWRLGENGDPRDKNIKRCYTEFLSCLELEFNSKNSITSDIDVGTAFQLPRLSNQYPTYTPLDYAVDLVKAEALILPRSCQPFPPFIDLDVKARMSSVLEPWRLKDSLLYEGSIKKITKLFSFESIAASIFMKVLCPVYLDLIVYGACSVLMKFDPLSNESYCYLLPVYLFFMVILAGIQLLLAAFVSTLTTNRIDLFEKTWQSYGPPNISNYTRESSYKV